VPAQDVPHATSLSATAHEVDGRATGRSASDLGIKAASPSADDTTMILPAAALAVLLLGFVVFYGTVLQSRLDAGETDSGREDSLPEV